uniref:Uncharacterized protein n=1 Tax=Lepeophtheirus salmonis TaxID=72036 RepID=A0A0K2V362_LEPSM
MLKEILVIGLCFILAETSPTPILNRNVGRLALLTKLAKKKFIPLILKKYIKLRIKKALFRPLKRIAKKKLKKFVISNALLGQNHHFDLFK